MFYVNANRGAVLAHLPKNMRVAEIGTQQGRYASDLLDHLEPRELHLIDPWIQHDDERYQRDGANAKQDTQDQFFNQVKDKFSQQINAGQVIMHRAKSLDVVSSFPDGFFDMVYVDAMHFHDAVLADLLAYAPKIRPGGILAGHDFCEHQNSASKHFSVVSAVGVFVKRSQWSVAIVTGQEDYPSYILTDGLGRDWVDALIQRAFLRGHDCIELPDCLAPNFKASFIQDPETKRFRFLPSFA
jgi:predicted O-methyltransferase YrrM